MQNKRESNRQWYRANRERILLEAKAAYRQKNPTVRHLPSKVGQRYGRLLVLKKLSRIKGRTWFSCRCDCGVIKELCGENLRYGKGGTQSCGCLKGSLESREKQGRAKRHAPFTSRFQKLKDIAKRKNRAVEITFEEYLEFTKIPQCHYCRTSVDWCPWLSHGNDRGYNIDRADNSLDYVRGNLVVCCPRCNWGKGNRFTYEEWWAMTECFRRGAK